MTHASLPRVVLSAFAPCRAPLLTQVKLVDTESLGTSPSLPISPHISSQVKLVDTESLGEYDEGEDRRFTAEPLVYSPLGEFVRSWWNGMSAKLGMAPNTMCKVSPPDSLRIPSESRRIPPDPFRFVSRDGTNSMCKVAPPMASHSQLGGSSPLFSHS